MRVDNAATQPKSSPAKSAGVAAMAMGATTHGHSGAFFHQILIDVKVFFYLPNCAHGPDRTFLNRPSLTDPTERCPFDFATDGGSKGGGLGVEK